MREALSFLYFAVLSLTAYLTALLVAQKIQHRMAALSVGNEVDKMRKEIVLN